jgi:hypothetical protein
LMRTITDRPLPRLTTVTCVPNGSVRCAAQDEADSCEHDANAPLVSEARRAARAWISSGTSCNTSMSGVMPLAWIDRPDGVK